MKISIVPTVFKFKVSSRSNFQSGFTLELTRSGKTIGRYSYALDDEGLSRQDVRLDADYLNQGLGKILVLKAIQLAHNYDLGYSEDSLGVTSDMRRVYSSLLRSKLIRSDYTLTDAGEDELSAFESTSTARTETEGSSISVVQSSNTEVRKTIVQITSYATATLPASVVNFNKLTTKAKEKLTKTTTDVAILRAAIRLTDNDTTWVDG